MNIKDLAHTISGEEVLPLKDELTYLHERELFERHIYFRQASKLTGSIVEILKRLNAQEEEHAYLLQIMLEKANLAVKEYDELELVKIVDQPLNTAIAYDVEQENISANAYKKAIEKSTGKIKQVLEHILQEEFEHIGLLEKFLKEA